MESAWSRLLTVPDAAWTLLPLLELAVTTGLVWLVLVEGASTLDETEADSPAALFCEVPFAPKPPLGF